MTNTRPRDADPVLTGSIEGDEVAGERTRYEGFKVDELTREYGPVGDTIENDHDDYINLHESGVYLRDLVMEATFINPTGTNWSYGFTFRHPYSNRLDVIAVSNFAYWAHDTKAGDGSEYIRLNEGYISDDRMWPLYPHYLLLIAPGDVG